MCFPRLREKAQRFDRHLAGGEIQSGDGRLQPERIVQISLNQGPLTTRLRRSPVPAPRSLEGQNQSILRGRDEGFRLKYGNLLEASLGFPAWFGISVPPSTSLDRHFPRWAGGRQRIPQLRRPGLVAVEAQGLHHRRVAEAVQKGRAVAGVDVLAERPGRAP